MNRQQYNEIEIAIKSLEKVMCRVTKKELAYVLRYTLHPYYLETLGISTLEAIADFNGYFPLQLNEIAKDYNVYLDTVKVID